jgi:hypothetical protein
MIIKQNKSLKIVLIILLIILIAVQALKSREIIKENKTIDSKIIEGLNQKLKKIRPQGKCAYASLNNRDAIADKVYGSQNHFCRLK